MNEESNIDKIKIESRVLEPIKYMIQQIISEEELMNTKYEVEYASKYIRGMAIRIRDNVWMERNDTKKEIGYEFPATWWDMFKEQHFTEGMKKRFPVKHKTHNKTVTFREIMKYPNYPTPLPKDQFGVGVKDLEIVEGDCE